MCEVKIQAILYFALSRDSECTCYSMQLKLQFWLLTDSLRQQLHSYISAQLIRLSAKKSSSHPGWAQWLKVKVSSNEAQMNLKQKQE